MSGRQHNFGSIDNVLWFGAGDLMREAAARVKHRGYGSAVFTSPRHLTDSLVEGLDAAWVPWFESEDINGDDRLMDMITPTTLGIAMGPAWIFGKDICEAFDGRLVNFMGIDLPRYRGGAHYSWQILRGDRRGSCNLQLINETVDSGEIVKSYQYYHPPGARIPADYFASAGNAERNFLFAFLEEIEMGKDFDTEPVAEKFAQTFPCLNTDLHGFVDWSWDVEEIERFINAFDHPYDHASTFVDGERVRLGSARVERGEGPFHPFMTGLVYRRNPPVFVACRGGSLVIGWTSIPVKVGHRFHTPRQVLDNALDYRAVYDAKGLAA